jgi:Tfp pilus assembly protein PilN
MMLQGTRVRDIEREITSRHDEFSYYEKTLGLITEMGHKAGQLRQRTSAVQMADNDRSRLVRAMEHVGQMYPRGIWMTSLRSVAPGQTRLEGHTLSDLLVRDLAARLDSAGTFHNVEVGLAGGSAVDGQDTVYFTITCEIR